MGWDVTVTQLRKALAGRCHGQSELKIGRHSETPTHSLATPYHFNERQLVKLMQNFGVVSIAMRPVHLVSEKEGAHALAARFQPLIGVAMNDCPSYMRNSGR